MSGKGKAEQIMGGPMDDDEEEKMGLIGGPKQTCMLRHFFNVCSWRVWSH